MNARWLEAVLVLVLLTLVEGVKVGKALNCTNCVVEQVLFPSPTQYLINFNGAIYLSNDEGQSWEFKLNDVDTMITTCDPQTIIFFTSQSREFSYTTNGGIDISGASFAVAPADETAVITHPNNVEWIIVFPELTNTLGYYTKDFGVVWDTFDSAVAAVGMVAWTNYLPVPDTFFALVTSNEGFTLKYTDDYGADWVTLFPYAEQIYLTQHFLLVHMLDYNTGQSWLMASSVYDDPTHTKPGKYHQCNFTFDAFGEQFFTPLDDSWNTEFVGMFGRYTSTAGIVFSSDFNGRSFTFSLGNVSQSKQHFDFDQVTSLEGVYIANQAGAPTGIHGLRSVITLDNGGNWQYISAPSTYPNGTALTCAITQNCSLHLHGLTSWMGTTRIPPFYSVPTAVGMMIGVGNIGSSLSFNLSTLSTYITKDGGLTWSQLWAGPTVYDFGDYGGVIVFAPVNVRTSTVMYTFDGGATIQTATFSNTNLTILNIATEPTGISRKFTVVGQDANNTMYVIGLDFSDDLSVPCDAGTDYENWTPTDSEHGAATCFMGATTTYVRRIFNRACYNTVADKIVSQTPCACAFEDYECDIGFYPSLRNSTQGFNCTAYNATDIPTCATGYRLVPDTQCTVTNGLNLLAYGCPGYSASALSTTTTTHFAATSTSTTTTTTTATTTTTSTTTATTATTAAAATTSTSSSSTAAAATTTTTSSSPGTSSTTGSPQGTTTGRIRKGSHAGLAVGLTFLFLFVGVVAVTAILYFKHPRFRHWANAKLGREEYLPINGQN